MFNTDTTPGQAFEGIFYWSRPGIELGSVRSPSQTGRCSTATPLAMLTLRSRCQRLQHGDSARRQRINYYEWCQDHNKPVEVESVRRCRQRRPGNSARSEYFHERRLVRRHALSWSGRDLRARPLPDTNASSSRQPSKLQANPANERGYAFMWHSHNEREITTNNVFPGGMLMMMLVDSREFVIDESN